MPNEPRREVSRGRERDPVTSALVTIFVAPGSGSTVRGGPNSAIISGIAASSRRGPSVDPDDGQSAGRAASAADC